MALPLSDALFERMRSHFSSREIVELLLVVGWYWAVNRLMTTLDIEPDAALGTQALEMLRESKMQPSKGSTVQLLEIIHQAISTYEP